MAATEIIFHTLVFASRIGDVDILPSGANLEWNETVPCGLITARISFVHRQVDDAFLSFNA